MKVVFVNGRLAIIVEYWEQHSAQIESGARVELRSVQPVLGRTDRLGTEGFSVGSIGDAGLWRADLFAVVSQPGTPAFHYHSHLADGDVGGRELDRRLDRDPRGWIADQLGDLPSLLGRCGADDLLAGLDLDEHHRALPSMLAAVDSALARLAVELTNARER